jgi:hypothetical protein
MNWKAYEMELSWPFFFFLVTPSICLEGLLGTTKTFGQDSLCPGRVSKWSPPEIIVPETFPLEPTLPLPS